MGLQQNHLVELRGLLTPEEIAAPTYLEWDDATIARMVRALAGDISDTYGVRAVKGIAEAIYMERELRTAKNNRFTFELGNGTRIVCIIETAESRDGQ